MSPNAVFYDMEKASLAGPELVFTRALKDSYVEPIELHALALSGSNPHWAERIALIRQIPER